MNSFFRLALLALTINLVISGSAFAAAGSCSGFAGGTCPSSIPSGVTSFYFIDYAGGSDANNGTSESSPWQHTPGMANATGNAASHTPTPGEGWIFKGGVKVDYHAYPMNVPWSGASGKPDYMGYDSGWYTGTSWSRPIFDGGGSSGYDASSQSLITDISHHASYVIIDNLELTNLYWRRTCSNSGPYSCGYVSQYGYNGTDVNWEIKNVYIHGWHHCAAPTCDDPGNEAAFLYAKQDSTNSSIHDSVVDGSDSSQDCCNAMSAFTEYNNYIAYVDNAVFGEINLFHDNVITKMVVTFGSNGVHGNCIHLFGSSAITEVVYNNYVTCLNTGTPDEMFLVEEDQATVFGFNNVLVKDGHGTMFELGLNSSGGGKYTFFNNTGECGVDASPSGNCVVGKNGSPTVNVFDNFFISTGNPINQESGSSWKLSTPSPIASVTCSSGNHSNFGGRLVCSPVGSGNGSGNLNLSQDYPFAPLDSVASAAIGTGQNNTSSCATISRINADAGTSCLSDTTLGVAYNAANHTVSWPARSPIVHPASGAWEVGAYEFSVDLVTAPTGLAAVVE